MLMGVGVGIDGRFVRTVVSSGLGFFSSEIWLSEFRWCVARVSRCGTEEKKTE